MTPRFYLRVDDFPAWTESMEQFVPASEYDAFHQVLASHGIPYMLAATPQPALSPLKHRDSETRQLTLEECNILQRIAEQGTTIALHGVTHRSRSQRPHSEFIDLDDDSFRERIVYGDLEMRRLTGITAEVFVPPFNRITRRQFEILCERFRVVCGGPETVPFVGRSDAFQSPSNVWYLPSYPPCYGRAHEILSALDGIQAQGPTCLTLHWEWERRRGYDELNRLCAALAGRVQPWQELVRPA